MILRIVIDYNIDSLKTFFTSGGLTKRIRMTWSVVTRVRNFMASTINCIVIYNNFEVDFKITLKPTSLTGDVLGIGRVKKSVMVTVAIGSGK